jgi:hypothetical protein
VPQVRRVLLWGLVLPLVILALALLVSPWALALVLIYPLQIARLALRSGGGGEAWERAWLLTVGKFAETQGVLQYHRSRLSGRRSGLIEYK